MTLPTWKIVSAILFIICIILAYLYFASETPATALDVEREKARAETAIIDRDIARAENEKWRSMAQIFVPLLDVGVPAIKLIAGYIESQRDSVRELRILTARLARIEHISPDPKVIIHYDTVINRISYPEIAEVTSTDRVLRSLRLTDATTDTTVTWIDKIATRASIAGIFHTFEPVEINMPHFVEYVTYNNTTLEWIIRATCFAAGGVLTVYLISK